MPAGRSRELVEWQRRDPGEIWRDMTALTPNKEEQHYAKLIALIGEWEAEEISAVLVVGANSQ